MKKIYFKSILFLSALTLTLPLSNFKLALPTFSDDTSIVLEKVDDDTVKFKTISGISTYHLLDDNHNVDDVILQSSDADIDGYLYYSSSVVGKHNIQVTTSNTSSNVVTLNNGISHYACSFSSWYIFTKEQILSNDYPISQEEIDKIPNFSSLSSDDKISLYLTKTGQFVVDESKGIQYNNFSTNSENLSFLRNKLIQIKESGANAVQIECQMQTNPGMASKAFTSSDQKILLDECWSLGLKVIFHDYKIIQQVNYCKSGLDKNGSTTDVLLRNANYAQAIAPLNHFQSTFFRGLMSHKAFLGFTVGDEPDFIDIPYFSNVIKYINSLYDTYDLNDKITMTYLYPYHAKFSSISDYKNYLTTWIDSTDEDYFFADAYSYTASGWYDGCNSGDCISSTFKTVESVITEYKGLGKDISFTLMGTANRDKDSSNWEDGINTLQEDIYSSMLIGAAFKNRGLSWFTYDAFYNDARWDKGIVDYAGNPTSRYKWVKDANKQFFEIKDFLYGYEMTNSSFDEPFTRTQELRTLTSTYKNNDKEITMIVNYNTSKVVTTKKEVFLAEGTRYKIVGINASDRIMIGTNNKVYLINGQGIIIFDKYKDIDSNNGAYIQSDLGTVSYANGAYSYILNEGYSDYRECFLPKIKYSLFDSVTFSLTKNCQAYIPLLSLSDVNPWWSAPSIDNVDANIIVTSSSSLISVTCNIYQNKTILHTFKKDITDASIINGNESLSFYLRDTESPTVPYYVEIDSHSPKVNSLSSFMALAYKYKTNNDGIIINDEVRLKIAIPLNFSDYLCYGDSFGLELTDGKKTVRYKNEKLHSDIDNNVLYSIINLGNAITNSEHMDIVFTVKGFLITDDATLFYTQAKSYSVRGMIEYYYSMPETKKIVSHLYHYINSTNYSLNEDIFEDKADLIWEF